MHIICLLRYFVMGVYPPRIQFNVSVILEERKYRTLNNSGVWKEIERLEIGPQKRIVSSASHTVRCNQCIVSLFLGLIQVEYLIKQVKKDLTGKL